MNIGKLEVGKTYRPIGAPFGPVERRTVMYSSPQNVILKDQNGDEQRTNPSWSVAEYEEVLPWFEVGKVYKYISKYGGGYETTYKILAIDQDAGTIDAIETTTYKTLKADFKQYVEVKDV